MLCGPAPVIHGTPGPWFYGSLGPLCADGDWTVTVGGGGSGLFCWLLLGSQPFCPPGDMVPKCQPHHQGRNKSEKLCHVV